MTRTALITGASAGLGAEYARRLAARGADLVLVARDRRALDELAAGLRGRFAVDVEVISADLTRKRDLARVSARLADRSRPVEILVNNAGFGLPRSFERNDVEDEVKHLRLHVEAPMRLTHAALPEMLRRGRGRVVNVASVAAYMPSSTYGASKRWLISFSRWANVRYAASGVTVTAVCPGFTRTQFHERMGVPPGQEGVPDMLWLDASRVVRDSLRDVARGRAVSVPSLRYKIAAALLHVLPARIAMRVSERGPM